MTKNKKKNPLFNKILFVILGLIVVLLAVFVGVSKIYLDPVDKNNNEVIKFTVPQGTSKNSIAESLEKSGLIKNALFFKFYIKINSSKELYAGTYNLSKNMSVNEIIDTLNSAKSIENESITVTFIEGKRLTDYVKKISDSFNFDYDEVLKFIDSEEFVNEVIKNNWFVTDTIKDSKIYHPLEGYLFPDTYNFKKNSTYKDVILKLINTMGQKLEVYKDDIEISDHTVHELLTLASIIELEGAGSDDRAGVAGVFYNRLDNGWSLGSDVTTYYGVKKDFSKDLSNSNLRECNGYNTRAESSCPIIGLPVGPIASPSLASIDAALNPKEHDYYYFVADKNKKTYCSKDYSEHARTVANLKSQGLWYQY